MQKVILAVFIALMSMFFEANAKMASPRKQTPRKAGTARQSNPAYFTYVLRTTPVLGNINFYTNFQKSIPKSTLPKSLKLSLLEEVLYQSSKLLRDQYATGSKDFLLASATSGLYLQTLETYLQLKPQFLPAFQTVMSGIAGSPYAYFNQLALEMLTKSYPSRLAEIRVRLSSYKISAR